MCLRVWLGRDVLLAMRSSCNTPTMLYTYDLCTYICPWFTCINVYFIYLYPLSWSLYMNWFTYMHVYVIHLWPLYISKSIHIFCIRPGDTDMHKSKEYRTLAHILIKDKKVRRETPSSAHCNTLQHTATLHTATQHTATRYNILQQSNINPEDKTGNFIQCCIYSSACVVWTGIILAMKSSFKNTIARAIARHNHHNIVLWGGYD